MPGGVRSIYRARHRARKNHARLATDTLEHFPDEQFVNAVLRVSRHGEKWRLGERTSRAWQCAATLSRCENFDPRRNASSLQSAVERRQSCRLPHGKIQIRRVVGGKIVLVSQR